jgi:hypothetical protein
LGSEEVAVGQGKTKKQEQETGERRMMQLTRRDEQMLDWLNVVRMADIDAIRWALAGLRNGYSEQPVTIRQANQWIARMAEARLVDRVRPVYRDHQVVWPTVRASGRSGPKLFRQTMRHELAKSHATSSSTPAADAV